MPLLNWPESLPKGKRILDLFKNLLLRINAMDNYTEINSKRYSAEWFKGAIDYD